MWQVRELPPKLRYRDHSLKRPLRMPGRAGSDSGQNETFAEFLERKRHHAIRKANQSKSQRVLLDSLWEIAITRMYVDLDRPSEAATSPKKRSWNPAVDYRRIASCQSQCVVFKPACCGSRPVAVPIGCDHRLCPLCNAKRLQHFRAPVREIVEKMENPTLLTLTIPNVQELERQTFVQLRGSWKEFARANKEHVRGGLYAIECTYNREEKTWHPHVHVLFDASRPYTGMAICANCRSKGQRSKGQPRVGLSAECTCPFFIAKMRLEFLWLRITSSDARKLYSRNSFESWKRETFAHIDDMEWNKRFRRVVDVRAVKDEAGAVNEVVKYISKTNKFLDIPEAVEQFLRGVRGVRVIQAFGCFYNVELEAPITKSQSEETAAAGIASPVTGAASFLHCECGANRFERLGVYSMDALVMEESGRWVLKRSCDAKGCRRSGVQERRVSEWHLSSAKSPSSNGLRTTLGARLLDSWNPSMW